MHICTFGDSDGRKNDCIGGGWEGGVGRAEKEGRNGRCDEGGGERRGGGDVYS